METRNKIINCNELKNKLSNTEEISFLNRLAQQKLEGTSSVDHNICITRTSISEVGCSWSNK